MVQLRLTNRETGERNFWKLANKEWKIKQIRLQVTSVASSQKRSNPRPLFQDVQALGVLADGQNSGYSSFN